MRSVLHRLADRVKPAGILASIEDPMVLVRLATFTMLTAAADAAAVSALFFLYGEPLAGWGTVALSLGFVGLWSWHALGPGSGRMLDVVRVALVMTTANHTVVHVALGGYANSGAYLGFGVAVILVSSLVLTRLEVIVWTAVLAALAAALGFYEGALAAGRPAPDPDLSAILFVIVLVANLFMLVSVFLYFMERYSAERARAESLLLNVLPGEVAAELKQSGRTTARRFDSISVLFADVVGFTSMAAELEPETVVDRLNEVFTDFDAFVEEHGCEKIRTMGDAYMVASGVPVPRSDHAEVLAEVALKMLARSQAGPLRFRIGINSGPAMAGVIGVKKFQYDVWGDSVNIASRMESQGEPGRIQITDATYQLIKHRYRCTPFGTLEVKGRGALDTWFLEGGREDVASARGEPGVRGM